MTVGKKNDVVSMYESILDVADSLEVPLSDEAYLADHEPSRDSQISSKDSYRRAALRAFHDISEYHEDRDIFFEHRTDYFENASSENSALTKGDLTAMGQTLAYLSKEYDVPIEGNVKAELVLGSTDQTMETVERLMEKLAEDGASQASTSDLLSP